MKKLGIIGCGWLGYRLAQHLQAAFEIHTTVTTPAKIEGLTADGFNPEIANFNDPVSDRWGKLDQLDAIVITVTLFSRSTDEATLMQRRENLLRFISGFTGRLIMMSSTGIYKNATGTVTEEALLPVNAAGEREVWRAFPQATILRLGGLMGDDRQLKNYKVSEPGAPVNHIHFSDIIHVVEQLLKTGAKGNVYNVVAPLHPTKAEVISAHTGIELDVPVATDGKIVSSEKLIRELGYTFQYPDPAGF